MVRPTSAHDSFERSDKQYAFAYYVEESYLEGRYTERGACLDKTLDEPQLYLTMTNASLSSTSWIWSRMKRYGPAEVAGTITAALGVATATVLFDSPVWVAVIGTLSENVGFYSVIFFNELRAASKRLAAQGKTPSLQSRMYVIGSTCVTFGVAESVDSLLTRPTLLGLGAVAGEFIGLVGGGTGQVAMGVGAFLCKFAADIVYYSMVEIQGAAVRKMTVPERRR